MYVNTNKVLNDLYLIKSSNEKIRKTKKGKSIIITNIITKEIFNYIRYYILKGKLYKNT